jgi:adenylylsulfate kinase-like enzyme
VEVFVDCPSEVCAARDPKGLYARARAGAIVQLTGVDAPYEAPPSPDVHLDTTREPASACALRVWLRLQGENEKAEGAAPSAGSGGASP